MKTSHVTTALLAVLVIGGGFGYGIARWTSKETGAAASASGRKVLYWQDPMRPDVKFDRPGKSPYMDMDLVPVYADEVHEGPAVKVNAQVAQNLGIRTGKVERGTLKSHLSAVGSVSFDEQLLEVVQARVDGYVDRLHVKTTLVHVRRGQPLVDVVAPAWRAAQEEYLALMDSQSPRGVEIRAAARERLRVLGMAEESIRRLEADRRSNASTTIYSPTDGVVTELGVREGATFTAGAPLFRINALNKVWAVAQIPEAQLSGATAGSSVKVSSAAWPGTTFSGRVVAILPDVDLTTRTIPVRVEVDNPERHLVPGMFVSVLFAEPTGATTLLVPSEAIISTGRRTAVVKARNGGFDVVDVEVGAESEGKTEILSGLEEGDSIVLSGQFLIDSEASLRATTSRLTRDHQPAAGESPAHEGHP
jgi:Cu(I)/Ag(I) efflux system membrane fusion protein